MSPSTGTGAVEVTHIGQTFTIDNISHQTTLSVNFLGDDSYNRRENVAVMDGKCFFSTDTDTDTDTDTGDLSFIVLHGYGTSACYLFNSKCTTQTHVTHFMHLGGGVPMPAGDTYNILPSVSM